MSDQYDRYRQGNRLENNWYRRAQRTLRAQPNNNELRVRVGLRRVEKLNAVVEANKAATKEKRR